MRTLPSGNHPYARDTRTDIGRLGLLEEVELLERLADDVVEGSLCALGGSAPNPVLSTLRYFRDEVVAHVTERRCPAKVCRPLIRYTIDKEACTGCGPASQPARPAQ